MQLLMTPEIRTVIKHASLLTRDGKCISPSSSFTEYAYNELTSASLLPNGLLLADFVVCDYLAQLQLALGFTTILNTDVTFSNLVVLPESLSNTLKEFFGDITFDEGLVSKCHL